MADFNYVPAYGMVRKHEPRKLKAQFGDGYALRASDGINTNLPTYECKFEIDPADYASVKAFLESKGGVSPFTWVPPAETIINVVCEEWSFNFDVYGVYILSAAFLKQP